MAKLQRPEFVFMNGRLTKWDDAQLHIGCEAVVRGLNVFEGVKGYWQPDGTFGIVALRKHYHRLQRSARLLHIPFEHSYDQFERVIFSLVNELAEPTRDMWARATLFVTDGHWGEGTKSDLVITAYHQSKEPPGDVKLGVSTWRRSGDVALPARIKTSTNYQVARLARIEGRPRGWEDMVLLNPEGRVAEATAACVLMVRDQTVFTPPATDGALESITLDLIEQLARDEGIAFVRRSIDRTELLVADEIAMCGTLAELPIAIEIDGHQLDPAAPILRRLQKRFLDAARGTRPHPALEMVFTRPKHAKSEPPSEKRPQAPDAPGR